MNLRCIVSVYSIIKDFPILCITVRPIHCPISPGCKLTDVAIPGATGAQHQNTVAVWGLGFVRPRADVSDVYLKTPFGDETSDSTAPVSHSPNVKSLEFRCGDAPAEAESKSVQFWFPFLIPRLKCQTAGACRPVSRRHSRKEEMTSRKKGS